ARRRQHDHPRHPRTRHRRARAPHHLHPRRHGGEGRRTRGGDGRLAADPCGRPRRPVLLPGSTLAAARRLAPPRPAQVADLAPAAPRVAALAAATALAVTLVACGSSSPTAPSPPTSPTPPATLQLTCPATTEVRSVNRQPVPLAFTPPQASGGAAPVSVACTPAPGFAAPLGDTRVTCTATDARQATASCDFTV